VDEYAREGSTITFLSLLSVNNSDLRQFKRRHLGALANVVATAIVACHPLDSYGVHKHQLVGMSSGKARGSGDTVRGESDTSEDENGKDAIAMSSAIPAMKIRGSVRLFWNLEG